MSPPIDRAGPARAGEELDAARLEPWLRDTLSTARLARHGVFRPEAVSGTIDAAIAAPHSARLANRPLALASFQLWWERFFG